MTICDAGCGFGDINKYFASLGMKNYRYIGLDVVEEFMNACRENGMVYDRFMRIHRKEFADGTFVIHQK